MQVRVALHSIDCPVVSSLLFVKLPPLQGVGPPRPLPVPRPAAFPAPPQLLVAQPRPPNGMPQPQSAPRGYTAQAPSAAQQPEGRPAQLSALLPSSAGLHAQMPGIALLAQASGSAEGAGAASTSIPRPGALAGAARVGSASALIQALPSLDVPGGEQCCQWHC